MSVKKREATLGFSFQFSPLIRHRLSYPLLYTHKPACEHLDYIKPNMYMLKRFPIPIQAFMRGMETELAPLLLNEVADLW